MSFIGCLLGLQCAERARQGNGRLGWLALSALAIGGSGIWVMHFIAMLGFSIQGAQIRYNVPLTLLSAVTAVGVVWIGLLLVVRPEPRLPALLAGGAVTGLGVASMHYTGMYAMKSDANISYDAGLVTLSIAIAVVAATAALWFTLHVAGAFATIGAALLMGVAVSGMHYTGMASMHAEHSGHHGTPPGADALQLLGPLIAGISIITMLLLISVGLTSSDRANTRERARAAGTDRSGVSLRASSRAAQLELNPWWEDKREESRPTADPNANQYWPTRSERTPAERDAAATESTPPTPRPRRLAQQRLRLRNAEAQTRRIS
nr:MHYT domain-containing protein [Nocardia bovistercoris]